jgi:hypothetical protein
MRFIGERRAVAAAVLSFFMLQLLLSGLLDDGPFRPVLLGLGVAYLVAFAGVVAGWFWARWYTLGLAFSGIVLAVMTGWQNGLIGFVYVLGGTHLAVGLALVGPDAASFYDGRRDWRDKWKMDENAVNRLGKAVTRAGASLPYLIVAGLAPKQGMGLALAALILGAAGLSAVIRMRTWGLLALAGAAGVAIAATADAVPMAYVPWGPAPWLAAALLTTAVFPFAAPICRSLRRD